MIKKSVISLIAYDSHLLPESIKSYYPYVDEIILGLDKDRITWSGNKFSFNETELWTQLKAIDISKKIKIIEDNFHQSKVALENDNYQRNFLREKCTHDWIFSFDADEVLVSPAKFFIEFLPIVEPYYKKIDLLFTWFLPFKRFQLEHNNQKIDDTLVIAGNDGRWFKGDKQGFATHKSNPFVYCRWTNQRRVIAPLAVMHWSFCRPERELDFKINNFGHSDKTPNDPFFHNWKLCNLENYQQLRNFKTSGFNPEEQWSHLIRIPTPALMQVAENEAKDIY